MQQSYHSLSQQELRNLYITTGAILLLDIPSSIEFGIDNILWKVGQKFKGLKFIPFGPHVITYSLKEENHQFKIKKFICLDQSKQSQTQIIVMKWSNKQSIFIELKGSQADGYREGVKKYHYDSYLGAYPLQNLQFWKENTAFISRKVLQKLEPVEKIYKFQEEYNKIKDSTAEQLRIDIDQEDQEIQRLENQAEGELKQEQMDEQKPNDSKAQNPVQKNAKNDNISKKFQPLSDTIYYSQIPRFLSSDPDKISKVNLNKTLILLQLIQNQYPLHKNLLSQTSKPKSAQSYIKAFPILGQLQYSFIYFLIGEDEESFQQWKKMVNLFVFSQDIFKTKQGINMLKQQLAQGNQSFSQIIDNFQELALQFIVVLYNQLKQFPIDFFIDQLSKNSFMQVCLLRLEQYKNEQQGIVSKKVKKRLQKIFKLLSTKFNYQPKINEDVYDEDAPAIVQEDQTYF